MTTNGPCVVPPRYGSIERVPHSGIDLASRFRADAIVKSVVFPEAVQSAPPVGLLPDAPAFEAQQAAWLSSFAGTVSDLGFYCATNASVRGRGFVMKDGHRLYAPDLVPNYVEEEINGGVRLEAYEKPGRARIEVSGPVVHLLSEGYPIYGHWLIDMIPKAWMYRACLGEASWQPRFLIPKDIPEYGIEILTSIFDVPRDRMVSYDIEREEPHAEQLLAPSLMHNSHMFHPAMARAVAFVRERIGRSPDAAATPARIYVSRQRFRDRTISTRRSLVNEESLIAIAEAAGYTVVYPEELSWPDQVRLFAGATSIIGEGGSGLHNTMFADARAGVLAICQGTHVQGTLAALLGQRIVLLGPDAEIRSDGVLRYVIDPERFKRAVEMLDP